MTTGRMLGRADFEYLSDHLPITTTDLPTPGITDAPTPTTEEFRLRLEQWLNREGIDHEALMEWCMENALEDTDTWTRMVLEGGPPTPLLATFLATAYTLGIQMGWRLHQRKVGS